MEQPERKTYSVLLPVALVEKLDGEARAEMRSRNKQLEAVLAERYGAQGVESRDGEAATSVKKVA